MDNLEKQSGHFGWGLPEQTPAEISSSEARAFQDFANVMSRKIMRQPAKSIKNMELTTKIVKLQEEDGIEEGFSFLHLEKALFGQEIPRKPQLIGSCVQSGSLIVDTQRMLAEVFIFNEAQDLMGTTVAGINSFQPFGPFNYRLGRSYVGLNGGRASGADDGSLCAPHFRGKMEVGFLPCNAEGLQSDDYPEPQNVATYRLWGANDTLVNQFKSKVICKLTETEKVITADDVKTLICVHLKPLQICSMWAFEAGSQHSSWRWGGQPVTIYRRSRQQWAHNMSIVGCVKVAGEWYVIVQNTWGNMHNGRSWFPITLATMEQWLKDRDTECMSNGNFEFFKDLPPAVQ